MSVGLSMRGVSSGGAKSGPDRHKSIRERLSSLTTRIYVGFSALLLLLVFVATGGLTAINVTSRSLAHFERTVDAAVTISVIDRQVGNLLSDVLLYVNGNDKVLERIREAQRDILPMIERAERDALTAEHKAVLHRMGELVDAYVADVDHVIELKQTRDTIIYDTMLPLGKAAQQKLSHIIRISMEADDLKGAALAGLAQEALMSTLLNSTLFLVTADQSLVEDARDHVDEFVAATERLSQYIIDPVLVNESYEAGRAGPQGRDAFFEVVEAINNANTLINEVISVDGVTISTMAKDLSRSLHEDLDTTTESTITTVDHSRISVLILAMAATMLGLYLAWRIATFIVDRTREIELANTELQSARQRMVDAIESISEGFVLWDSEDRMVLCNTPYRKIYNAIDDVLVPGVLFKDVAAAAVERQHPVPEAEREEWLADRMARHLTPGEPQEQRMIDGRIILVSERQTQEGGIVGVRTDITALKSMEAQLVQASKLATLGEMATGVAHEINQPLTIMRMAAEKGYKYLERGNPDHIPTAMEKLKRIMEQVDRARSITDHMRTFGRKAPDQLQPLTLKEVVDSALSLVGEQMTQHKVVIRTDATGQGAVNGNQIQLEQVLINLLNNARDAMESNAAKQGGRKEISIVVGQDDGTNQAFVTVQDTGGGIDPKVLDRIFDPFFTTKDVGKGTGLGLSISYGIISNMGGTIRAENAGEGALFTISLPLLQTGR